MHPSLGDFDGLALTVTLARRMLVTSERPGTRRAVRKGLAPSSTTYSTACGVAISAGEKDKQSVKAFVRLWSCRSPTVQ